MDRKKLGAVEDPATLKKEREKIARWMKRWAKEHDGVPPRTHDWKGVKDTKWPSYLTVYRCFPTWNDALVYSGFEPRGKGRPRVVD